MTETIVEFFRQVTNNNDYLTLFLVSIIPIIELRGAIILSAQMAVNQGLAYLVCVAGSSIVIFPLLMIIKPIIDGLKKTKAFNKLAVFVEDMFSSRASKVNDTSDKKGYQFLKNAENKRALALFSFVSIPIPLTGAWMGSGIGSMLDCKMWKVALSIFAGNFVAGAILIGFLQIPGISAYIDIIAYIFLAIIVAVILFSIVGAVLRKRKSKGEKKSANQNGSVDCIENAEDVKVEVLQNENLNSSKNEEEKQNEVK